MRIDFLRGAAGDCSVHLTRRNVVARQTFLPLTGWCSARHHALLRTAAPCAKLMLDVAGERSAHLSYVMLGVAGERSVHLCPSVP